MTFARTHGIPCGRPADALRLGPRPVTMLSTDQELLTRDLVTFIDTEVSAGFEPVEPETDLMMTGLVDSLGVVLIVDWLEQRLGIQIDPADVVLENFVSVEAMVCFVAEQGASGAG